jgi:hypothetical protein
MQNNPTKANMRARLPMFGAFVEFRVPRDNGFDHGG